MISDNPLRLAWIDRSAAGLSGLCVLHCAVGGLALAALAPFSDLLAHQTHAIGFLLALPLAIIGLWRGRRAHGRTEPLCLGAVGLALMALALAATHGHAAEFAATATGAALLAAAHLANLRWLATGRRA